ncbi:MAG: PIN domain-containing protein [Terracidiphilus sp.]|jgi:predicted nucleic acid-binding protein
MSDKAFFDTNVLVYALGGRKKSTTDARIDLAQEIVILGGVVSVQVLNEFVQVCRRKAGLGWDQVLGSLQTIKEICGPAIPVAMETHETAINISRRYGFHIYDSLILAAAVEARCTTLFTEDLQHGQIVEGVRIENPFLKLQEP